jgi:hypoxanthine-DNA glycosylase
MTARLVGLPPLVDARTRVLVLGSFPGAASLAAQQYYGHPRNHFWPIMAHVFDNVFSPGACLEKKVSYGSDYAQRCQWLQDHGVGLWDVYASCERQGSLDVDIRNATVNDFSALRAACPQLVLVAHNGATSFRHHRHTLALGVPVVKLPSSSPANASWSLERKKAAWWAALGPALAG